MLSAKNRLIPKTAHAITQPPTRCGTPAEFLPSVNTSSFCPLRPPTPARYGSTPPVARLLADAPDGVEQLAPLLDVEGENNDLDHRLKLALTDLLNCSDVKRDSEARMWVQNRLMDTEHRLKARRRSRLGCGVE